ncbi:DBH-like monooxygenase protein 2 homolog [Styela clava]
MFACLVFPVIRICKDRHGASSNTYPPLDPEQNIEVLGGFESNGWTMFKFSRQIAACESGYDREIKTNTERFIWAFGDSDPTGDDLAGNDYHGTKRGFENALIHAYNL